MRVGVRAPKRPSATFFLRVGAKLAVNDGKKFSNFSRRAKIEASVPMAWPSVPMAWGGCVGTAGYPMGCHWCDLRGPPKILKPNRFAYPFRSSRGVSIPSILSPCTHTGNSNRYDSDWGTIGKKLGRNYASIYTVFRSDSLFGSKSRGVKPRGPSRVPPMRACCVPRRL